MIAKSMLAILLLPLVLFAQNAPQKEHEEYVRLSHKIYYWDEDPYRDDPIVSGEDEVNSVVAKLHDIIKVRILALLTSRNPDTATIVDAIKRIQGPQLGLSELADITNAPFAAFFELNGRRAFAVSYLILRGGSGIPHTLPFLEFYEQVNGTWGMKAAAPSELLTSTLYVHRMDAALAGEAWFLVWGTRLGDTGARLRIRLYGFNGDSVRTIWKRDDLSAGDIQVSDRSITLEYDPVYHGPVSDRALEILYITPNGLQ